MGSNDLSLRVILQAQDMASGKLKGFGSTLVNLAGKAGPLLSGLLGISVALIAIGAQAVQTAAQYQQSMNMVQALTGANSQQMAFYDNQLKNLAMNAGVAPNVLAQGLYNVLSAGYQGAQAMSVLTLATEDAKIGMTDAKTTTNALTVALKAFNIPASQFNAVNGEMLRTVTAGKMSMQDYASAISKTSSVAVQYKDNMSDMNAVLATLTSSGIKNANVAGTDYNNLLKVLNGNTAAVAKASEKINPAFNGNAFAAMNVHDKVMYLNKMIVQHGHNITEVIGKQQNASIAFTALATHAGVYTQNLKNLSDQQKNAKATGDAWAVTQGGFNQTLDRAKASVQVLFIDIGQKLLPVLTKIVGAVAPAVTWFLNFARAFSQNEVAMAFLKGALVGFIALILMILVPAFISWAIAAGSAAIATLAATWPLLLIAAIIAVVVAAIILAVKHWGAIVDWLKNAWGAIAGFFENLWQKILQGLRAVGQFFVNLWSGIVSGLKAAWDAIVSVVKAYLTLLLNIFLAPFRAIGALFSWLYQHNTYFQKLVDKIRQIVQIGLALLRMAWQTIINWLVGLWNGLVSKATGAWQAVTGAVSGAVNAVVRSLKAQWNQAISWLTGLWNGLKDLMSKAWQAVSGVLSGAWNNFIVKPLQNLWNSIVNFAKGWPAQALQWGENVIKQLIKGIENMAGGVVDAAKNIGGKIASFLGFHSPTKEGPGSDADKWAPNLIRMFSSGLLAGQPHIQAALNAMVSPMLALNHPPAQSSGYGSIPYGQPPISSSYSSYAGGANHYGNNSIVINGAGQNPDAIANAVMQKLNRQYRSSGLMGNPARGMRDS